VTASVLPRQWFLVECYVPGIERMSVRASVAHKRVVASIAVGARF
jgi:hypothetical protein